MMSFAEDPNGSPQRSRCNNCSKTSSQVPALRKCARCRTANYCTRECMITDWRRHRKSCCKPGPTSTYQDLLAMTDSKGWLSSLPDFICYEAVIDAYRLRIEDKFLLSKRVEIGTSYAKDFPLQHFNCYLEMAVKVGGLPNDWTAAKTANCLEIALDEKSDACILHAINNEDMLEKWGTPLMVNSLRMVADRAYGRVVEFSALRFTEAPVKKGLVARGLAWLWG